LVDTTRYLGVNLDSRHTGRLTSIRPERKLFKEWLCWVPPEQKKWSLHQERSSAVYTAHPPHDGLRVLRMEVRRPHPRPEAADVTI